MSDPVRVATPEEIRLARKRLGMTQEAFAKLLGFARYNTISDWERGIVAPSIPAALMEEIVNGKLGVRQDGHFVDPRSYALGVLSTMEAEVSRYATGTLERIAEARRVLGLTDAPVVATPAVPAAVAGFHSALAASAAAKSKRRPRSG